MFNRTSHRKFEITAPPSDLANKLQHPPPALLLQEQESQSHSSNSSNKSKTKTSRPPVQRHASTPILDGSHSDVEGHSTSSYRDRMASLDVRNQKSAFYNQIPEKKKKSKFSFLKKKHDKEEPALESSRRALSRTPESIGRKQITVSQPGSAPLVRRPQSATSDRQTDRIKFNYPRKGSRDFLNCDDEVDDVKTDYPRIRGHHPIPVGKSGGYDALEKYQHLSIQKESPLINQQGSRTPASLRLTDQSTPPSDTSDAPVSVNNQPLPSIPGLIGIKNHGNTCFMNAILQCLSNTENLLQYFLTSSYQKDLSLLRRRRRRSAGLLPGGNSAMPPRTTEWIGDEVEVFTPETQGAVTEYLGVLLKSIWNGQYEPKVSAFFKEVVGLWAEQYRGHNQHDAQEFFLWLLDHLHEDLNHATGQCSTKNPNKKPNQMEEQATETLSDHLQRHDSLIYNLFGAQYHSSLHCPGCNNFSNTFDPYLCVSLSVPRRGARPIYITMARRHHNTTKLMLFGLSVKVNGTIRDIQRQLSVEARTLPHYLVIGDMKHDGFYRFFRSTDPVSAIGEYSPLYAYEVTPYKGELPASIPHPPPPPLGGGGGGGETIFIILQNSVGQGEYSKRFGTPLCLRVWRDFTYSQIQSVVFKSMKKYLLEGINPEVVCRDYIFFKCRVLDGLQGQEYIDPYCPSPLMTPSVEKALSVSKLWGYELHIKIIAEWEQWVKDCVCMAVPDVDPPAHASVQMIREHYSIPVEATLDDCLEWHTREEKLDDGDSWTCPQCAQPQTGATKKISFWTLPDILVLHLKRFEQDEYSQSKLNTLIKFPIKGLNMTPYLTKPDISRPSSALGFRDRVISTAVQDRSVTEAQGSRTLPSKSVQFEDLRKAPKSHSPTNSKKLFIWKKSKKAKNGSVSKSNDNNPIHTRESGNALSNRNQEENLYDLYAVSNHHGDMIRGHYIANCLNPINNCWYVFDDHHVLPVYSNEHLVTQHAYVLFYKRRGAHTKMPKLKVHDSERHWIYQIPKITLNLSGFNEKLSPKRQGSVTSAQTMSTASGVSPDNTFITSPSHNEHISPRHGSYFTLPPPPVHVLQLSNSSSSSVGPPLSPQSTIYPISLPPQNTIYPNSLPSPTAKSTVSYLSQPYYPPPHNEPFTKRGASFYSSSRYVTSQSSSKDTRSATRV